MNTVFSSPDLLAAILILWGPPAPSAAPCLYFGPRPGAIPEFWAPPAHVLRPFRFGYHMRNLTTRTWVSPII